MPVSADPTRTFDYWLESDKEKPIESRPVLVFRFPTRRQRLRAIELRDEAIRIGSGDGAWQKAHESIGVCLAGWRNQVLPPEEFALDRLGEIFSDAEIVETMHGWLVRSGLAEEELRFFASPAPAAQEPSANPAAGNAPTNPPQTTP